MTITNASSGTNVHEIAAGIYRINTATDKVPGGFSFNQYLILDDQPLLFHTGPRKMFPLVREAVESVIPVNHLRFVAFSHFEADECGSLNEWLAAAPQSMPLCGQIAALVSVNDVADRPARAMGNGEELSLGRHSVKSSDSRTNKWRRVDILSTPAHCASDSCTSTRLCDIRRWRPRSRPNHDSISTAPFPFGREGKASGAR